MALVKTTVNGQIGGLFYEDTSVNSTKVTLATSGTYTIHQVSISNTDNTHKTFLKIYSSDPTVGTTHPDIVLPCEASANAEYSFSPPPSFSNLYYAAVREGGTHNGTATNVANAITVQFIITSS